MSTFGWIIWTGIGFGLVALALMHAFQVGSRPRRPRRRRERILAAKPPRPRARWQKAVCVRHSVQGTIILPRGIYRILWGRRPRPEGRRAHVSFSTLKKSLPK